MTMEEEFNQKLKDKDAEMEELRMKNADLEQLVADLASITLGV
jgi:cell division protein FtsB